MTRVYLLLAVFFEFGWGGGIRTPECQDQNLVPYHLATPHRRKGFHYFATGFASSSIYSILFSSCSHGGLRPHCTTSFVTLTQSIRSQLPRAHRNVNFCKERRDSTENFMRIKFYLCKLYATMFMMKCLKLNIDLDDRIADVFEALQQAEAEQILILCPRNWGMATDATLLKKLVGSVPRKNLIFVIPQKFARDFVSHLGFATVANCSVDTEDVPEYTVSEVLNGKEVPVSVPAVEMPTFVSKSVPKTHVFSFRRSQLFFAGLLLLFMGSGLTYWLRPHAIITVKPKIEAVPIVQNIIIALPDAIPPVINADLPMVSGIFVENTQEGTEDYPTTGRKYDIENARGKVTIFNENPREKFFVPSRLESPDGIIFRFANEITVPASANGSPGELEVSVVADPFDAEGIPVGFRGNIDAGTTLHFAALPPVSRELWYAIANKGPLVGGSTLTHFFVVEEDELLAEDYLKRIFKEKALEALNTEVENRSQREENKQKLLDDSALIRTEFIDYVFPKDLIGLERKTIPVSGTMRVSGLVFSETEVEEMVLVKLQSTLDDRQKLLKIGDHSTEYRVMDASKFWEEGWVKVSVKMVGVRSLDFESSAAQSLAWQHALKKEIIEKTIDDAKAVLVNQPEIERIIDIQLFPFWRKTLPKDKEDITLQTDFD